MNHKAVLSLFRACSSPREKLLMYLLWDYACRACEVSRVLGRHVDLDARTIQITRAKGGISRIYPMSAGMMDAIRELPELPGPGDRLVPLGRHGVYYMLRRLGARAIPAILDVHPHEIRHARAQDITDGGASIDIVADLLGHASLSWTRKYFEKSPRRRRRDWFINTDRARIARLPAGNKPGPGLSRTKRNEPI